MVEDIVFKTGRVLAHTTLKSMGAKASTAPIPTETLQSIAIGRNAIISLYSYQLSLTYGYLISLM